MLCLISDLGLVLIRSCYEAGEEKEEMWDSAAFLLAISATSTSGSQVQTQKSPTSGASINEENINGAEGAAYKQISSTGFLLVCSSPKFPGRKHLLATLSSRLNHVEDNLK